MTAPYAFLLALQTPTGGTSPYAGLIFEFGIVFVALYLLFIRPQQKQRKQQDQMLRELKKGDEIVTAGGVVGEVIFIKTATKDGTPVVSMEDRVTIKSADTRLIVERGRIARVGTKETTAAGGGGGGGGTSA